LELIVVAVAWFRNPVLDESADIVDRNAVNERTFGVSSARRHPAYVYSISGNACLMHKVRDVQIQWYALIAGGRKLGRLKQPAMIAHTVCGMSKALVPERTRTCHVPKPDSVLCGVCHGEPPTFGKHGKATKARMSRRVAHVKLGCITNGYPSLMAQPESADAVAKGGDVL
jgi:hypothetical protein